ncbi:Major Facilitator Superfamily protein [Desulfatibacillum alkenivorans DSM 16219]|jgi:MFS family permease|uniref:Major Facilitator Superfamily protein n=1 Tax=Desulfatibacillum alkenivorans DSM 16219 TaxID=1121393 RepID=A0A1M6L2B6_9BACT|nr:MFS transporter [Desulfatibacillum alkenivorans]SHJ65435.1 Major Facilitator Superfamily protein [Desulfatibacillum alkenivorans DSM 16219]
MEHAASKKMYVFLMVLTIASALSLQTWMTLFNNFAVERVGLDGQHVGTIQSIREIPGFLSLLAIFVMLVIKEHRLSALSILFLGGGVALTGFFPSFQGLIITTLIMSFGFHYFETTNQSLTLQYFDQTTSPRVFGRLRSLASGANIFVGGAIFGLAYILEYREIYLVFGGIAFMAGLWAFGQNPTNKDVPLQKKKMILKREYGLYYFLTFMAGARRQIFMAFAVFLMVQHFGYAIKEVTLLFMLNNLINYFLAPFIGKAIIRFGERKVLSVEYGSLILVFIAYATTQSKAVVGVLYVLDHIFFNCSIAIRTYFQKIGDPQDIAPTMAVGFTINHIAAVVIPVLGGLMWMIDYRIPFFAGAAMSLVSLAAVQKIKTGQNP